MIPLLLWLTLPLGTSGLAVFQGTPGGAGDVVIADPSFPQPPVSVGALSGVHLLPIDVNGRVELDSQRPDRPKLRNDVPGASRVQLPGGAGSLYRYSKPGSTGVRHGLFVVDSIGEARVLLELQGVGPALDQSPLLGKIATSPAGDALLVPTNLQAGGDLLEVDVATGAVKNRTSGIAPQSFLEASLHLGPTWGVAGTSQGLWRFARATASDAAAVPMPAPSPSWFSGEVVLGRNGAFAITTAGSAINNTDVYVFSGSGSAVRVTSAPAWISPAGFEPEYDHGPYLAVSDDGTRCAWRTEGATRELFLAQVPAGPPSTNHWLSADNNYIDTIDEIGQVIFRIATNVLIYAAGEFDPGGAPTTIENLDFFEAQLNAGGPAIKNVTLSSGIAQPPFLEPGELKAQQVSTDPQNGALIFFNERSGGSGDLVTATPGQSGFTILVSNVKDVDFIERAGNQVFVNLQRKQGNDPRQLYRFTAPFAPASAPLLTVSGANHFDRVAPRADGWFAFVERTAMKERLWRVAPTSSSATQLTNRQLFYGPAIGWAPSGELGFSVGAGGTVSIFAAWPTQSPVRRLPIPVGPGFVLPGA